LQLKPYLGYIIVGDLQQSELYVKLKLKACDEVGIGHIGFKLPATTSEQELMNTVKQLQDDPKINGVLV
jgi:methylenetetrahydrofolate dehydrogenase (NADP+) / methenyltetrahydrofolate cyclohydrolase